MNIIYNTLDNTSIKCYILTNSECRSCKEWFDNFFNQLVSNFPSVEFYTIDCYKEHSNGNMFFPPAIAPTFYFYKNKTDFPIISQGALPEPELSKMVSRAIKVLKND